jgi:uncharacterized protein (TIGR03067 family)
MRRILPLLAVLLVGFAPAPFPKPVRGSDMPLLQGAWFGGGHVEARFKRDRLTYYRDGKRVNVYRVTLEPKAEPKAFDLAGSDGRNYRGIYSLEKDTLKMCSRGRGKPRPTAFEEGNESHFEVLKRQKP